MNAIDIKIPDFSRLSGAQKAFVVGAAGILGFLGYSYFAAKEANAATAKPATKPGSYPLPSPFPLPSSTPAQPGVAMGGGALQYTVTTKDDASNPASNLMVRSGAGLGFSPVGFYKKGDTVMATGRLASASDGQWAEVYSPLGATGWSNTAYLTATAAGIASANVGSGAAGLPAITAGSWHGGARVTGGFGGMQ